MTGKTDRISVFLQADDPIYRTGVAASLRRDVTLQEDAALADVALVVADDLNEDCQILLRRIFRTTTARILLLVTTIDGRALVTAAECGAVGIVRRADATTEHLTHAIQAVARGDGHIPPDLQESLLIEVGRVQSEILGPRGLHFAGLSSREIDVLRLIAEGHDTSEIARQLTYSERTIKNVLHSVTERFQLRTRAQAAAWAIRQGLI